MHLVADDSSLNTKLVLAVVLHSECRHASKDCDMGGNTKLKQACLCGCQVIADPKIIELVENTGSDL